MASTRSLFSRSSSSKRSYLSSPSHELPRWRTPSPMTASIIPPPIVESTYISSPVPAPRTPVVNRPDPLQERQDELEADLQFLLDAQAEVLTGGLDAGLLDDRASTGSTTPTAQSVRSASAGLRNKPVRRKPGIRSARKGIYNSMLALSAIKAEELQTMEEDISVRDEQISKIDGWQEKRARLQEASQEVDSEEDSIRSQRVRQEADVLQEEINHVELQLAEMKARQRKLLKEVAAAENAAQAKMASYSSSLRMLEQDVQRFLSSMPIDASPRLPLRDGSASVWQLPPKRRTLDLAKQYWIDERDSVVRQRENADLEKAALDEGAVMWKQIVISVNGFERLLREDIAHQTPNPSGGRATDEARVSADTLAKMDQLIQDVESKFELARSRDWNLLIAAIGAELDALKRGRTLLGGAEPGVVTDQGSLLPEDQGAAGPATEVMSTFSEREDFADTISTARPDPTLGDDIHELDKKFAATMTRQSNGEGPEDDPDPDLLFSTHDGDSEHGWGESDAG